MFTEVAADDLLAEVRAHDFAGDPVHEFGANRIDAIVGLDRLIRAAQAEQLAQIAALHDERVEFTPATLTPHTHPHYSPATDPATSANKLLRSTCVRSVPVEN